MFVSKLRDGDYAGAAYIPQAKKKNIWWLEKKHVIVIAKNITRKRGVEPPLRPRTCISAW